MRIRDDSQKGHIMTYRTISKVHVLLSCIILLLFAHSAFAGTTERVSVSSAGAEGNSISTNPSISADGRYVAFESEDNNLVSGDTNSKSDIFVRDRETGLTERVSVASTGTQGNNVSRTPSISSNGRYVAFTSLADNLVSGDTNNVADIFVRDRETGTTELVSVSSAGVQGNGESRFPSISADGGSVAFFSDADNLVSEGNDGYCDIYVRDRKTGTTERVSVSSAGKQGNGDPLGSPSISADGRYVAFADLSSNLVSGDTNSSPNIFVRDRETGTTEQVNVSSTGVQGNDESEMPSISADGRYVAFTSYSSNLVSGDTNNNYDIFIRDQKTGTTELISVSSSGVQANSHSWEPSISADGRYVAFSSSSTNLVSGDTNSKSDVFVRDRETGTTELVSFSSDGVQGNGNSSYPSISADGGYVAFQSVADNLVSEDTNGKQDIFVRKLFDQPLRNLSLTPNSGSIQADVKTVLSSVYTDTHGVDNIRTCYLLVNNSFSMTAGYLFYDAIRNKLYLRPPGSSTMIGGFAPGRAQVIDNGYIKLNCLKTTVQRIGNQLTINWSVTFKLDFVGTTCNAWMQVANKTGDDDKWKQMGSFSMVVNPTPKNESLTPNNNTITVDQQTSLSSVYSDPAGYANIRTCYLMLNTGATTSGAGYLYYDSVKNLLYLRKTNEAVLMGGFTPGSANVIDNGAVTLYCADTNVQKIGNNVTVNWSIALKPYFTGNPCTASMQVTNRTGYADLWEQMGVFTVN